MFEILATKFITKAAYPLSLCLCGVILSGFLFWRHRAMGAGLLFSSAAVLWICALPSFADFLRVSLEARFPPVAVGDSPAADAIVVLGGAVDVRDPPRLNVELRDTSDRVLHAARLYKAGKAPVVLAAGGFLRRGAIRSEAQAMGELLMEWGVPTSAILLEPQSLNTRENALFCRKLLGERKLGSVLLVTSALHMRRALAAFRSAGIDATPSPTDYGVVEERGFAISGVLPDADALAGTTRALKEYMGYWVYAWRGWAEGVSR